MLSNEIINSENYIMSDFAPTSSQIRNARPQENGDKLIRECAKSVTNEKSTCSKNKSKMCRETSIPMR